MSSRKFFDPTHKNPYLTFAICLILLFLLVACSLIGLVPKSEPRVAPPSPTPGPFQIVLPDLPEGSDNHEQDKEVQEEEDDDSGIYEEGGLRYSYSQGVLTVSCIEEGLCRTAVRGYGWKQAIQNGHELVNAQLKVVKIEEGILALDKTAFANCSELTTVYLPSTLVSIDDFCFASCTNLSAIYLPTENCEWSIYAFQACPNLNLYTGDDALIEDIISDPDGEDVSSPPVETEPLESSIPEHS